MTTERTLRLLTFVGLVALASLACGSPGAQGTVYMDMGRIPPALRADYESFAVNCSKCHSLARALNAHVTEASHWDLYVARMMRTAGSSISPQESPKILRFLHWYTGTYKKEESLAAESLASPEAIEQPAAQEALLPTTPAQPANTSDAPEGAPPVASEGSVDVTQKKPGEAQP